MQLQGHLSKIEEHEYLELELIKIVQFGFVTGNNPKLVELFFSPSTSCLEISKDSNSFLAFSISKTGCEMIPKAPF